MARVRKARKKKGRITRHRQSAFVVVREVESGESAFRIYKTQTDDAARWDEMPTPIAGAEGPEMIRTLMTLYRASPWVYAAVRRKATAVSSVRWRVKKIDKESQKATVVPDSHRTTWLGRLLSEPNDFQTWQDLIELCVIDLSIAGWHIWEKLRDPETGEVRALWRLRPDRIRILADEREYWRGVQWIKSNGATVELGKGDVVFFRQWSPLNDYGPISGLYSAVGAATLEQWARTWNKSFFRNGAAGLPEGVFETDARLDDERYERLKSTIQERLGHAEVWRSPLILDEGLRFKPTTIAQKDLQFAELMAQARAEILGTLEVPPAMVGVVEGAALGNFREQRHAFYSGTVLPLLRKIEATINRYLAPPEEEFEFDLTDILSLIEDLEARTRTAESLVTKGIQTINEVRRELGLEPVGWGNTWYAPLGLAPVSAPGRPERPEQLKEQVEERKAEMSLPVGIAEKLDVWKAETKALRTKLERDLRRKYDRAFRQLWRRVLERLRDAMAFVELRKRGATRLPRSGSFDLPTGFEPIDVAADLSLLEAALEEIFLDGINEAARRAARTFGVSYKRLIETSPPFRAAWDRWKKYRAQATLSTINERIKATLRELQALDKSPSEALRDVEKEFEQVALERAKDNVVADATTIINTGAISQREAKHTHKQWVTVGDGLVRDRPGGESHRAVARKNNGIVRIDEDFEVPSRTGFDRMSEPGDPRGSPENTCNCRCVIILLTEEEARTYGVR